MCEDYISLTPASYLMADVTCNHKIQSQKTRTINKFLRTIKSGGLKWFIKKIADISTKILHSEK